MTTLEAAAEVDLRYLVSLPGRTISVYFRRPLPDESTTARRQAVVVRLAEQGVGAEALRDVDDALCDVRPGFGAVALFGPDSADPRPADPLAYPGHLSDRLHVVDMPDLDVWGPEAPELAVRAPLPALLPLLAWRQTYRSHLPAEAVDIEIRHLLDDLAGHLGPDGLAVQGAPAVLHALARKRVETLLVTDSPTDERVAWFGEAPTELSGNRAELERTGTTPHRGRLVDVAVRAALLTGADIRVLRPGISGAPAQGLGALCRFQ